jgi:phosphoglycerate dehydrogenase-like enzyme
VYSDLKDEAYGMQRVVIGTKLLRDPSGPHHSILQQAGFEIQYPKLPVLGTEADAVEAVRGAYGVIAGSEPYTDAVLEQLPDLQVISRSGVGYDAVDVEAATRRGIAVTIVPSGNHQAVAEYAFSLMLALAKWLFLSNSNVRAGRWCKPAMAMRPLRGKTLGIVGLGRIGRSLAVRASAFGMNILAAEKQPDENFVQAYKVNLVDLDTLFQQSDYVSLHVPLGKETAGLINRTSLAKFKPGSFLINTARGGLVVEADLLEALRSGHLAGAGLDVFAEEPVRADNPLLSLENVVASPHVASSDTQADHDTAVGAAQNIVDLSQGRWPGESVVNQAVKEAWQEQFAGRESA